MSPEQKFQFAPKKKIIERKVQESFEPKTWDMVKPFFNDAYAEAVKGLNRDALVSVINNTSGLCEQCGVCCHRSGKVITITNNDILRVHHVIKNVYKYFSFINGRWRFKHTKVCAFLKTGKCLIHKYRPSACRIYPITKINGQFNAGFHKSCKMPENLMVRKITMQLLSRLRDKVT